MECINFIKKSTKQQNNVIVLQYDVRRASALLFRATFRRASHGSWQYVSLALRGACPLSLGGVRRFFKFGKKQALRRTRGNRKRKKEKLKGISLWSKWASVGRQAAASLRKKKVLWVLIFFSCLTASRAVRAASLAQAKNEKNLLWNLFSKNNKFGVIYSVSPALAHQWKMWQNAMNQRYLNY